MRAPIILETTVGTLFQSEMLSLQGKQILAAM